MPEEIKSAEEVIIETMGRPFWNRMISEYWDEGILKAMQEYHNQFTRQPAKIVLPSEEEINVAAEAEYPMTYNEGLIVMDDKLYDLKQEAFVNGIIWYASEIEKLNNQK